MADLVQELIAKKKSSKTTLIKFGNALRLGVKYIICIEGNDEPYYSNIVRSRLNTDDIVFIRCDGRDNVIDLLNILKDHTDDKYKNSLYFGFVDKDYHVDYINQHSDKLYITSSYSFENYYTSLASFKRILSAIFHTNPFGKFSEDYTNCVDGFLITRDKFIKSIYPIDIILRTSFYDRIDGINTKKVTNCSNVKLSSCNIKVDDFIAGWSPTVNDWLKSTEDYVSKDNYDKFSFIYSEYDNESLSKEIRGKYIFDFFIRYIKILLKDATALDSSLCFSQRKACEIKRNALKAEGGKIINDDGYYRITVQESGLHEPISFLATYADVPECLTEFIDNKMKSRQSLASAS